MPYFAEYTYNLTCSMFYNFLCDIDNLQEPSTTDIMLSRIEREIPKFVQVRLKYRGKVFSFPWFKLASSRNTRNNGKVEYTLSSGRIIFLSVIFMRASFIVCTQLSWLQPGEQADKPEGLARYTTTRTKHENSLVLQATLVWRRGHGWNRERKKKLRSALEENLDCDVPTWAAANDDKSHSLLSYLNRHLRNNVNTADYSRRKLTYIFKVTITMVFHGVIV